jgi:hypothetical protein
LGTRKNSIQVVAAVDDPAADAGLIEMAGVIDPSYNIDPATTLLEIGHVNRLVQAKAKQTCNVFGSLSPLHS